MSTPHIALIIGSTRTERFADKPAAWLMEQAAQRDDLTAELVDLRAFDLPMFDDRMSNKFVPTSDQNARAWQAKLAEFDGFIFIVSEHNHSMPGSLKNALDHAYREWNRKPMGVLGYGGVGAARAVEHLRCVAVELEMVPVRGGVHIAGPDFFTVYPMFGNAEMTAIEDHLRDAVTSLFDEIVWWANATKAARG
jgi:NAD(P)H-dependent FMN reductase